MRNIENTDIYRRVYSDILRYIQGHSTMFSNVQAYWGTLMEHIMEHIQALLRYIEDIEAYSRISSIIKAYSHIFRHTLCNPCILKILLAIFRALTYLELEAYSKPCETFTRNIQNLAIVRTTRTVYSGIIQSNSGIFKTLCNAYISRNLAYSY